MSKVINEAEILGRINKPKYVRLGRDAVTVGGGKFFKGQLMRVSTAHKGDNELVLKAANVDLVLKLDSETAIDWGTLHD